MARKGNTPDKETEQETGSKRRYQSPQTPPQAPRSRTQGERGRQQDGRAAEFDGEARGDSGRGQATQGRQQQSRQGSQPDWQDDAENEESFGSGSLASRGSDFDLQKASRDELNAIAQELNIDEYDTMTREELVIEIRERS